MSSGSWPYSILERSYEEQVLCLCRFVFQRLFKQARIKMIKLNAFDFAVVIKMWLWVEFRQVSVLVLCNELHKI